jgi:hypothetical protein|nr:MAG TPA: hypothetical protein [Caudoviricetes sp.]
MYIIPTTTSPNQTFTSTIPIDGKKIKLYFFLRYNTEQNCWQMDISNSDKEILVSSVPLICGLNLLEQYSYLGIGAAYIAKIDNNINSDRPNDKNLGNTFLLVWGDTE